MTDVSIIIVSMNKPAVLSGCLDSIRRHTHAVTYETLVVAYLYSKANLLTMREKYPEVQWIESNEIRGFSENNNLALRQAQGQYCFVVNDDTLWSAPLINQLVSSMRRLQQRAVGEQGLKPAIVSPVIHKPDGVGIQYSGRAPISALQSIGLFLNVWHDNTPGAYTHQHGLFRTYNICGAAFLIDRAVFERQGWFDERFFFCPEDIALSTELNHQGYSCWVDSEAHITHLEGMSGRTAQVSFTQAATMPAYIKGTCLYYARGGKLRYGLLALGFALATFPNMCRHYLRSLMHQRPNADQVLALGERNVLRSIFDSDSPKQAFIRFFHRG